MGGVVGVGVVVGVAVGGGCVGMHAVMAIMKQQGPCHPCVHDGCVHLVSCLSWFITKTQRCVQPTDSEEAVPAASSGAGVGSNSAGKVSMMHSTSPPLSRELCAAAIGDAARTGTKSNDGGCRCSRNVSLASQTPLLILQIECVEQGFNIHTSEFSQLANRPAGLT